MENNKKAVIYARQSSGADDYSESIERQKENCRKLAEKENLEVIGVFQDLNTSGKTYPAGAEDLAEKDNAFQVWFDNQTGSKKYRAGLAKALKQLETADFLIVDDITRLYRPVRGSYLENFINNQITGNGVKILQCKGGKMDLSQFDENLVNTIRAMINDEQIANGKAKSKQQLKARRDSGLFANGGGKAFGTCYNPQTGKIEVKADYIPVIQYVFNSIAGYVPTMQILRDLNAKFPGQVKKVYYQSHIHNIARNPVYCGFMRNTEGELIENRQIVNPCIDFAMFSKVQKIMQERTTGKRKSKYNWLPFSGLLYCGECGSKLMVNCDRGNMVYSCQISSNAGKKTCSGSRINIQVKKNDFYTGLYDCVKPLLVLSLFDLMDEKEKAETAIADLEKLEVEKANLESKKEKLTGLFISGLLTADDLEKNLKSIKARLNEIAEKRINCRNNNPDETTRHFNSLYKRFQAESFLHDELDRAVYENCLKTAIKRINVYFDRIEVETIFGNVSIPRIFWKNKRNLPVSEMVINGKENLSCIITYKTGKKGVLADFGRVKVITR